jgi:predicted ester cyclase
MKTASKHRTEMTGDTVPAYGIGCSVPDYILGITFEIWEEGQVDKILQYYGKDVVVFGLDGITEGAADMVDLTHATLRAFPGRLLIGDDVIWSGSTTKGYSSHRVYSPMINQGDSVFGPATGRRVHIMNMADCEIRNGLITREWLVRDNLALVTQLRLDPLAAARAMAERFDSRLNRWLQSEFARVIESDPIQPVRGPLPGSADDTEFARAVLSDCWIHGSEPALGSLYAPYCVMQRAPVRILSGRNEVMAHYAAWRNVLPDARLSIDHVASQPYGADGRQIAVRWSVAGTQQADFAGCPASGNPIFILGVTHWRVLDGRIISEWTVFDELALMAQSLSGRG